MARFVNFIYRLRYAKVLGGFIVYRNLTFVHSGCFRLRTRPRTGARTHFETGTNRTSLKVGPCTSHK